MSRDPSPGRPDVEPSLDRDLGWVTFRQLSQDPAERDQPAELFEFLRQHGVRADVTEETIGTPVIELRGIPNLDVVEGLLLAWRGLDPNDRASALRPAKSGKGVAHAVNGEAGLMAVRTERAGYLVVELLADRQVEVGDEFGWDDAAGLGAQVFQNLSQGRRLKVYVAAKGLSLIEAMRRLGAS